MKSYINLFRNYGNFKGFLNRSNYWIALLVHLIIVILTSAGLGYIIENPTVIKNAEQITAYLTQFLLFYLIFMIIPILSASVRRLHTLPKSGWYLLLLLIPVIGWIIVLVMLCKKGNLETLERLLPNIRQITNKPRFGFVGIVMFIVFATGSLFLNKEIKKNINSNEPVQIAEIIETTEPLQQNHHAAEAADITADEEQTIEETPTAFEEIPESEAVEPPAEITETVPEIQEDLTNAPLLVNRISGIRVAKVSDNLYMSVTETNVKAYRECIDEDVCKEPYIPSWVEANEDDDLPVVYVTQSDALTFCEWASMRLPNEAEWELAAQSSDPSAKYPWGKSFKAAKVNFSDSETIGLIHVDGLQEGSSAHGMLQMLGNVREWTDSAMTRGGGYLSNKAELSIFNAYEVHPEYGGGDIGFRCAVSADAINDENFVIADAEESETFKIRINAMTEAVDDMVRGTDDAQMALIPGGTFTMGLANGAINEKPAHEVTLSEYKMDIFEITNAQYALCVSDGVCTAPAYAKSYKRPEYYGNPEFDNYPVVWVTWDQANTYCEWAGGRLPTEAEWEFAARGESGNIFPWGNTFDDSKLNYAGTAFYDTHAVDEDPGDISEFGVYNLSGNVSEWVYDRYQENWYSITTQNENPTGPDSGPYHTIRGASCQNGENNARTVFRFFAKNDTSDMFRGFRCVVGEE